MSASPPPGDHTLPAGADAGYSDTQPGQAAVFIDTVPRFTVSTSGLPVAELDSERDMILDLDLDLDLGFDGVFDEAGSTPPSAATAGMALDVDLSVPLEPLSAVVCNALPKPNSAEAADAVAAAAHQGFSHSRLGGETVRWHSHTRRVLVVSADADERMYIRARLAIGRLVWMDEVTTTTQAMAAMDDVHYVLVIINLDSPVIDSWVLARHFKQRHPRLLMVATTAKLGGEPLWALWRHWGAWQLRCRAQSAGFDALLTKPLQGRQMVGLLAGLQQNLAKLSNHPQG